MAGGADRAARRHLHGGDRAGAGLDDDVGVEAQQLALRLAAELGVVGCWRSSCSKRPMAGCWSTSWRCARTTPGTGPWTGLAPASSSSICARCWTIRSATPAPPCR
ncbi:phosphoribosylaminoimidazole carboxylase ATPase subunit PurK domain protein [Mycobacterium xenopi 3993]|nr:phosphoribosylaminoimidazole carboxylase ATPase subunit PurK domain protein [Mycobacterium xenopi 3993]